MNEPMQDGLRNALSKLRESAATEAAPVALEQELLKAFRSHHQPERRKFAPRWAALAAVAASVVLAATVFNRQPAADVVAPDLPLISREAPVAPVKKDVTVERPKAKLQKRKAVRGLRLAQQQPIPQRQLRREEEFVEIPYAPLFTAEDEGQIVRVSMPGSSVRRLGIPVVMDRVQADVLVGNDGLARAIRVVSHSGLDRIR